MEANREEYKQIENEAHTPYTILIVEDDEGLLRLIRKNLTREGFHTAEVSSGAEAIAWITENPTMLLLLDYNLPDISGKTLIETLAERKCKVPFIIITGQGDERVAVEMMKLGALEYLVKDAELLNMLPSVVNRVLGQLEVEKRLTDAEEELKNSEERYHNLIEFANVGIIVSENGKITHSNRKAVDIYGYSKEELIGRSPGILVAKEWKGKHRDMLNEFLHSHKLGEIILEEEGMRKDGSIFPVEISFTLPQPGKNNVIAIMRDISERKEMEEKLFISEKLKSLGELAAGVAHDFNNVLAAILGRAQLLKMSIEPPLGKEERRKAMNELKKGLDIIAQAAQDGAETVRRIQEFSRRKVDDRDFKDFDINVLLEHALEFTRAKWKDGAESKGIKINIQKELSFLPPIAVCASEIREVFTNIINNATDAMPQGGEIKIKTSKENSNIAVRVEDTGVGIPKDMRDKIFDPFFTTKGPQSSGLGMSVSYGIINRHRGSIEVDSVEGKGTTFVIKLPITERADEGERIGSITEDKRKASILVIEDEEKVRNLLSSILIKGGHAVETASNGRQGIEMFEKKEFDLVFTDLGMPGMSGWQVAEQTKGINRKVPVVLITGWNIELKEPEMKERDIDLIIYKPFEVAQVLQVVQEGMELRGKSKTF